MASPSRLLSHPRSLRLRRLALVVALGASASAATAACVYKSSNVSGPDEVCSVIGQFLSTCSGSPACAPAVATGCARMTDSLSETAINGLVACQATAAPCDGGAALREPCATVGSAEPSSAQAHLARDYCAICAPASQASCVATFYTSEVAVLVTPVFAAADPIIETIDSTCIPSLPLDAGASACATAFDTCAQPILAAQLQIPSACFGEGGVAPPIAPVSSSVADGGPDAS